MKGDDAVDAPKKRNKKEGGETTRIGKIIGGGRSGGGVGGGRGAGASGGGRGGSGTRRYGGAEELSLLRENRRLRDRLDVIKDAKHELELQVKDIEKKLVLQNEVIKRYRLRLVSAFETEIEGGSMGGQPKQEDPGKERPDRDEEREGSDDRSGEEDEENTEKRNQQAEKINGGQKEVIVPTAPTSSDSSSSVEST